MNRYIFPKATEKKLNLIYTKELLIIRDQLEMRDRNVSKLIT